MYLKKLLGIVVIGLSLLTNKSYAESLTLVCTSDDGSYIFTPEIILDKGIAYHNGTVGILRTNEGMFSIQGELKGGIHFVLKINRFSGQFEDILLSPDNHVVITGDCVDTKKKKF